MMETNRMYQCPSCQQLISFNHPGTNLIQCRCGTVLVRQKETVESKAYFTVLEIGCHLAPGVNGKWREKGFTLTGRMRCWFQESVVNYWTIVFDNGDLGWLREGYGLYTILLPATTEERLTSSKLQGLRVGDSRKWKEGQSYRVQRKDTCHKWELQGEIWMPAHSDGFRLIEASAPTGMHLALFEFEKQNIAAFDSFYCSVTDLNFVSLPAFTSRGKRFSCTKCSVEIHVKTYPHVQSCACVNCGAYYVAEKGVFKYTKKSNKNKIASPITLGCTGTIQNIAYEVIGFAIKQENNIDASEWREYVLYNPLEGYAFLSEYDGHWMYVLEKGDTPILPNLSATTFTYDNEPYRLFNRYHYSVVNALGEFPYNAFQVRDNMVKEFISPPEMWIQEVSRDYGMVWYLGAYIKGEEISNAFEMPAGLPPKSGIGAIEPKGYISRQKLVVMTGIAALFLLVLHLLAGELKENRIVLDETYYFKDSTQSVSFVSPRMELHKRSSNLELDITSPVDNSWFALEATLVNTKTGTEYVIEKGVEYYHGYDGGESWTEGSRHETAYLTQIPAGTYLLQLKGLRETRLYAAPSVNDFHLRVTYDVPNHRNLLFCLFLLVLWPVGKYLYINHIEKSRWYNSPFSPYTYED